MCHYSEAVYHYCLLRQGLSLAYNHQLGYAAWPDSPTNVDTTASFTMRIQAQAILHLSFFLLDSEDRTQVLTVLWLAL